MSTVSAKDGTVTKLLLTAKEAAEYLCVKEQTVRNWAAIGKLQKVKAGGRSFRRWKSRGEDWFAFERGGE